MTEKRNGQEVILVGRGIAYGLCRGDTIPEEKIEKRFELSKDVNLKFEQMIQDMSLEIIIVSEEIIHYIKEKSDKEISDSIYVTLTDHISNLIERIELGIQFDTAALLNMKILYQKEYKIALQALGILRKRLNLEISDEEANFITLHIVSAESNANMMMTQMTTAMIGEILEIIRSYFSIQVSDNLVYDRFITHCRFFAQRITRKEGENYDDSTYSKMLQVLVESHGEQYRCVNQISEFIQKKYHFRVEENEKMYLLLHLIKLTEEVAC